MATITFTISASALTRLADDFSAKFGYTGYLADGVTPQTKQEFTKKVISDWIIAQASEQEASVAANNAAQTAKADARTNIIIA